MTLRTIAAAALAVIATTADFSNAGDGYVVPPLGESTVTVPATTHSMGFSPYGLPGAAAGRIGRPYYYRPSTGGTYGAYRGFGGYGTVVSGTPAFGTHGASNPAGPVFGGGDVYGDHFGAGFHRNAASGHYRFPYYSYRRPWYHVGPPVYNADTNLPW